MTRYYVTTYDIDRGEYTPQQGVRTGPYTQFGLRKAIRALRKMGYDGRRSDASIYVTRTTEGP